MPQRLSTRSVIVYGFLSVITILIVITAIGLARIQNLTAGLDQVVKVRNEQMMLMHNMRYAARERSILLQSMLITKDPFMVDDYAMDMSRAAAGYFKARQELLTHDLTIDELELLEEQNEQTRTTGGTQNQIVQLLIDEERDKAAQLMYEIALPGQRIAMQMMDHFITLKRQQNLLDLKQTTENIDYTYGQMLLLSIIGVLISLAIAYFVSQRINNEMARRLISENTLRHSELRERTIRENIVDGVITLDASGTILSCNRACKTIFECEPEEMIGKSARMLLPSAFQDKTHIDLSRHLKVWERRVLGSGHEVVGMRKGKKSFPAELDISRIELDGEVTFIALVRDITEKKAAEKRLQEFNRELEKKVKQRTQELASTNEHLREEIEERIRTQHELTHLASHDSLTQLPNRAFFTDALGHAIAHAERRDNLLALLFMDLDGFKQVNDTYGHEAGDRLLIEVSKRMQGAIRGEDVVARMGGDEFTVILNELSQPGDAEIIAQKLIDAVNPSIECGGRRCHVGISIGIAYYPDNALDPDTLIRLADDAMYAAKAAGKNCFHQSRESVQTIRSAL